MTVESNYMLRLLRLMIGLKDSRQFFSQWEAKPKPIATCTRDFSRALSKLQIVARNCDWFIALFVPVVIGRSNCFGFSFSTVICKPLYWIKYYVFLTLFDQLYFFSFTLKNLLLIRSFTRIQDFLCVTFDPCLHIWIYSLSSTREQL